MTTQVTDVWGLDDAGEGEPGLLCIHLPQWVSITHPLSMLRDFTNLILSLITAVLLDKEDESQECWTGCLIMVLTPSSMCSFYSLNRCLPTVPETVQQLKQWALPKQDPKEWAEKIVWAEITTAGLGMPDWMRVTREKWTFYKGTTIIWGARIPDPRRPDECWFQEKERWEWDCQAGLSLPSHGTMMLYNSDICLWSRMPQDGVCCRGRVCRHEARGGQIPSSVGVWSGSWEGNCQLVQAWAFSVLIFAMPVTPWIISCTCRHQINICWVMRKGI